MSITIEKVVSLAKRRGFVFQGSEIYGGLANTWDYGPLGIELKNNIKRWWWKNFVQQRDDCVGLDSAILMNKQVWEASGHVGGFSDPLMDCKNCKARHRADKLLEDYSQRKKLAFSAEGLSDQALQAKIAELAIPCPVCGKSDFTDIRKFNLMFKTYQGVTEESQSLVYLRPETAQGIFINFKNIQTVSRKKLPFGVAQIGKAFRNEITPGNFIFRTREFEQMEIEYFCDPADSLARFQEWQEACRQFLLKIGLDPASFRLREHAKEELSHYSQATTDIEFLFPFGWGELWGIAHRGDYDLAQHQATSGKDLEYFDPIQNRKFLPHVIEPSLGVDRLLLAILVNAYQEDKVEGEERTFLRLHPLLAPIQLGVLPLTKKQGDLAHQLYSRWKKDFATDYDETGSIGKRYRRFDEIGVPFCVTVDFETETDQKVTIRHRDDCSQERIGIDQLASYLRDKIAPLADQPA